MTLQRLSIVGAVIGAVALSLLLLWMFRAVIVETAALLILGRYLLRRAFPRPRRSSRRGKSLREWFDTGLLALIAYRLPPRAKREKINLRPTPIYRGDRLPSESSQSESWPEDLY